MLRCLSRDTLSGSPITSLEVPVHYSDVLEAEPFPQVEMPVQTRPHPDSFDSADECSMGHLLELYRLVDVADHELDRYLFDDICLHVA
jgi:hypothetical protein